MQVCIYASVASPRLAYICQFIFKELLGAAFSITTTAEEFRLHQGLKINYSKEAFDHVLNLGNTGLLFQDNIMQQEISCTRLDGLCIFFQTKDTDYPFDIFSASFYLLSRYEEYLPHIKDMYGRYAHEQSLAFTEGFLKLPLVNSWVSNFATFLKEKYPNFTPTQATSKFLPTYDIDIAYSYKHKGLLRNIGGAFKHPSLSRIKVLAGVEKDPFDAYKWMDDLHDSFKLAPVYFFLVADKNGAYDKNILPQKKAMHALIYQHSKKYKIGIHPSWQSGDDDSLLKQEKNRLEQISGTQITASRQHYIRFNLPDGYKRLIDVGITDDYSMGYGSINGFRASAAASFFWFDLEKNEATSLRVHPFCFMEANSFYEQNETAEQAYEELLHYISACKNVHGNFISIWHNNFLGTGSQFAAWRNIYKDFISHLARLGFE